MKRIRTVLVDDNETFLDSLAALLGDREDIEVVGRAKTGIDGYQLAAQLRPDLVLVDFFMVGMNGLEATQLIKAQSHAPRVIVLSLYTDHAFAEAAKQSGADAFVQKQYLPENLWDALAELFPSPRTLSDAQRGGA
jgi:DNA-binding NarL/FixJ family response regulator